MGQEDIGASANADPALGATPPEPAGSLGPSGDDPLRGSGPAGWANSAIFVPTMKLIPHGQAWFATGRIGGQTFEFSTQMSRTSAYWLCDKLNLAIRETAKYLLEEAAMACEQQAQDFLSPEYATPQPIGSVQERFACGQCAAAIRAMRDGASPKGGSA